jgi:hypothetical protein
MRVGELTSKAISAAFCRILSITNSNLSLEFVDWISNFCNNKALPVTKPHLSQKAVIPQFTSQFIICHSLFSKCSTCLNHMISVMTISPYMQHMEKLSSCEQILH